MLNIPTYKNHLNQTHLDAANPPVGMFRSTIVYRKSAAEFVMRSGLGICDKSKWNKMPSLSIMKLMLFVPKVAAVIPNVSAPEQKISGKELTDTSTEFCGYSCKEFDPELKLTIGLKQI